MGSNNLASPPSEDIDVRVEGDVSGQVAIGEHITQVGDVYGGEITFGQRVTNFFLGSTEQQRAQRNRQAMLQLVKNTWIKGVLEQSLHGAAMIELGMEQRADAVEHPWDMVLQVSTRPDRVISSGTQIVDVLDEMDCALLILGEPGSGKTTTLLELARDTVARAENDPAQPIPVVFNLSSWAEKRQSIAEWLVEELNTKYHIPKRIARPWVENDDLLLLLDGLDEVKREHREACVEAINAFRREHGLTPLVVCSRVADYEALTARLQLRGAVKLQPLSLEQIERYLTEIGGELAAARDMLWDDPTFQELVKTPLMLSVMTLVCQEGGAEVFGALETLEARRRHLFDVYVRRMFERRGTEQRYTPQQTVAWLAWLARGMEAHGQTIFQIEGLQPSWLAKRAQRWGYLMASRVAGSLAIAAGPGLTGLPATLLAYYLLAGMGIALTDGIRWALDRDSGRDRQGVRFWHTAANVMWVGLLSAALLLGVYWVETGFYVWDYWPGMLFEILLIFALLGLPIGLLFGLRGARQRPAWDIQTVERLGWSWRGFLIPFLIVGVLVGGANFGYSLMIRAQFSRVVQICNADGKPLARLKGTENVEQVAISPDGARIVTYHSDDTLRLWNAEGQELPGLQDLENVRQVVFSPDGARMVMVHADGSAQLWDADGRELPGLEGAGNTERVVFGPNGMALPQAPGNVAQVVFSPDGARMATVHENGAVRLWDANGEELPGLETPEDVWSVAFSPDGARIVTLSLYGSVQLWNAEGQVLPGLEDAKDVERIIFSPDGARIVTHHGNGTLRLWDADGQELPGLQDLEYVRQAVFSPDGARLVTVHDFAIVRLWDVNGERLPGLEDAVMVKSVILSPDGARIVTRNWDDTAQLWDADGEKVPGLEDVEHLQSFAFSSDGARMVGVERKFSIWAGGNYYSDTTLWNARDGAVLAHWLNQLVAFGPDGSYLVLYPWSATPRDWVWVVPLWVILGLVLGVLFGLRQRLTETKTFPNQGIHLSLRNAFVLGLVITAMIGATMPFLLGLGLYLLDGGDKPATLGDLAFESVEQLYAILVFTLLLGIPAALGLGGLDVIQHYVLRLILRIIGHAPWRYARFLDYATERIFLRKVGGGYVFIHRLLQEHFASLVEGEEATA